MSLAAALLNVILIDLVLSGDNSIVIGLAAHRLPPRRRRQAIVAGGAAAVALRVILSVLATVVLRLPYLRLVGGAVLVGLAFRLLGVDSKPAGSSSGPASFGEAMASIIAADAVMSLDNVLAVAAAARGHLGILVFGLGLSMALMMLAGGAIASLLNRWAWLSYLGAAAIAWTGTAMALQDPAVAASLTPTGWVSLALSAAAAGLTLLAARWWHARPR